MTTGEHDPFVAQLAQLCREHPTRAKWVFVPAHAIGQTLGDRLVRSGTSWANLRFVTPLDLALRMAAPILVDRGLTPSEDSLGPALIMRLLLDLPDEMDAAALPGTAAPCPYYRSLAGQPSMAEALWTTLRELRMAGLRSADLVAFCAVCEAASLAKHRELAELLASYERYLETQRVADMPTLFEEAVRSAEAEVHPQIGKLPQITQRTHPQIAQITQSSITQSEQGSSAPPSADDPSEGFDFSSTHSPGSAFDSKRKTQNSKPSRSGNANEADRSDPGPDVGSDSSSGHSLSGPVNEANRSAVPFCPIAAGDIRTELPGTVWSPLQRRLIDAMPGVVVAPAAIDLPGLPVSRRAASLAAPTAMVNGPGTGCAADAQRLRYLLRPAEAPPPIRDGSVELFRAAGRDAEIEEIFRRVFRSGLPVDQVEIAAPSDEVAALIWEKACRYDWPVTTAAGVRAAVTRPGRALLGYCTWIENGFGAGVLRRLLQSGDVTLAGLPLGAGQAARLLLAAEAGWGRATYRLSLSRLALRYQRIASDADAPQSRRDDAREKAARAGQLLGWVEQLLAALPEPSADGVALVTIVDAAAAFLATAAARMGALDALAHVALTDRLTDLRALGAFRCSLTEALRFIAGCVDGLTIGRDRARPGHLHVSQLATAGFDGRPLQFLMGLEEGRVFPPAIEDPVLLDEERSAIDPRLRLSSDRLDESVSAILSRVASAGTGVVFSYSCRDLREYRETLPSSIVLQAFRVKEGQPDAGYDGLERALGPPLSNVPSLVAAPGTPDDASWWLAQVKAAGLAAAPDLARAFPAAAAGRDAERQRAEPRFSHFDGHVPEAGPLLDPTRSGRPVSVTTLEDAASCAFRFFLKQGLRVEAIDDRPRDADVWLDHLTRGSELHALYASMMREIRAAGGRVDPAVDAARMRAIGLRRLGELRIEMPPPSEEVFEREAQELLRDLDIFIRAEGAAGDVTGVGFEVSFGLPLDEADDREPLAREDAVEIQLPGLRFLLRGRIDRINRLGPSSFEVVDYKTGRFWDQAWRGVYSRGRRLQHALYRLAAGRLLTAMNPEARVARGVYYFSCGRGRQQRVAFEDDLTTVLPEVLAHLFEAIRGGTFLHATDDDECRYCDFGAACGRGAATRAAGKFEHDVQVLAPFGKLARIE